jgi:hypothetical protein
MTPIPGRRRYFYVLSVAIVPPVVFDMALNQWQRHHPDPGVYLALTIGVVLGLAATWALGGAQKLPS